MNTKSKFLVWSGPTVRPWRTSRNIYVCLTLQKEQNFDNSKKTIKRCLRVTRGHSHSVGKQSASKALKKKAERRWKCALSSCHQGQTRREEGESREHGLKVSWHSLLEKDHKQHYESRKKVLCPIHKISGRKQKSVILGLFYQQESLLLSQVALGSTLFCLPKHELNQPSMHSINRDLQSTICHQLGQIQIK